MPGFAERAGGSEEEIEQEREHLGDALPGIGMSAESNRGFEHRLCKKCGEMNTRYAG